MLLTVHSSHTVGSPEYQGSTRHPTRAGGSSSFDAVDQHMRQSGPTLASGHHPVRHAGDPGPSSSSMPPPSAQNPYGKSQEFSAASFEFHRAHSLSAGSGSTPYNPYHPLNPAPEHPACPAAFDSQKMVSRCPEYSPCEDAELGGRKTQVGFNVPSPTLVH